MQIRLATPGDLIPILAIYNDAIVNTTAVYEYQPHTPEMRQAWYDEKIKKNIPVLVAVEDNSVVGFSSYGPFRAWAAYQYSVEHSVYVHPDYRQRGIASLLLTSLMDSMKDKKIHTVIAGIDAENEVSIRLHLKLGFVQTGHFRQVGFKFNRWLDLKFFQRIVNPHFNPE